MTLLKVVGADSLEIASLVELWSFILVTIPTIIYCGYHLHASWNEPFLIKRRRAIIMALYILSPLLIISNCSFALYPLYPSSTSEMYKLINHPIAMFLLTAILLLLATRIWLL